nr:retrovirus-related Pol polyprotein from transposon TNT 1-94 [Tanacetum cinerariifolium]
MNYLEEQINGEAMINSIKNGDQPLPRVTQVSISGTLSTEQPPLKDKSTCNKTAKDLWDALARHMLGSEYGEQDRKAVVLYEYETFKATEGELLLDTYIRYLQVINDLKKCGYSKDNCELNFKFLNNLQPEWKQYATMMRHNKNLMDINIDALYNILKQNQGDVNDAMGSKMKIVVVTSDPLALIAEKMKVSKSKEKVAVSLDSEGSEADDFSKLKKITALLAKAFNRRKFYSKQTNNNLRTSSTSQSANKKQEFIKSDDNQIVKKADEKKRDVSRVKCYNCKKEGHFAKDCKKAKVKNYKYYKTKMLLAKKDKDEQVLLAEDQAWMESSSDLDQEINANMVFMAQIKKVLLDSEATSSSADEKIFEDDYFQEIINPDFEKIDSPFQQTSSLIPYVPNVILKKIIINLEDEIVNLLEKEKVNLETIKSLKSKSFESSEKDSSESENQCENDCLVVEKECDKEENPKVIAPGMFNLNVSQCVSPISMSNSSCDSNNVEIKLKRKRHTFSSVRRPKNSGVIWKNKGSSNTSNVGLYDVSVSNLNKNVRRYSRKDLLACNNSHLGETSGAYMCNDAMNISCNPRLCDVLDDNNFFIFDDKNIVQICLWIIDSGCSKHMTDDASEVIISFIKKTQVNLQLQVQRVRTDNGTEFKNKTLAKSFDVVGESSSSLLNDDVQQSPEEVILPQTNTQSIPINMIPNGDEASTSYNVFNEQLKDAYFDASTSFHDPSNVHTYYQPYPHENKWTKDHPLHKIISDPKSSVRTRGQLENSCLFSCLISSIKPANVAEALSDADWVSAMKEELDQFARLNVWRLVPRPEGKSIIKTKWIFKNKKDESSLVIRNKARLVARVRMIMAQILRTPQQNGVVERRNRTLVKAARTMLTFANLPSFLWAEAIATACFTQNRLIIHKRFDKTPYELINKRKQNIKFFRVFGCRCYLLNNYEDVTKLKAKGDIGVFVGYSKESAAFKIYNKRTRKIHESVNVNFDEISEMDSKQFSLKPGLSTLNETEKSLNLSVSQVDEASKKDLEDLFQDFYDEYFDSSKIIKSSTSNV